MDVKSKISLWLRKRIINLKRKPHIIPLVGLIVASMIYTFNLSAHSKTISYFPSSYDAFLCFITTLFSILSIFTFTNYYGKMNYLLLGLAIIMTDLQIVLDIMYLSLIRAFIAKYPNNANTIMYSSYNSIQIHIISLIVVTILLIIHPIYVSLRKKKKVKHEAATSN